MESMLKTDFDLLVAAKGAGYDEDKDPFVFEADRSRRKVKLVGFDLDNARYGNDSENAEHCLSRVRRAISDGMTPEQAVARIFPDKWNPGDLADTPSGMGGAFTVKLRKRSPNGGWFCKIHMPRNPDWHGENWHATNCQLREPT